MPSDKDFILQFQSMANQFSVSVDRLRASLNRMGELLPKRKHARHLRFSEEYLERTYQNRLKHERVRGLAFVDRKVTQVRRELGLPLTWED